MRIFACVFFVILILSLGVQLLEHVRAKPAVLTVPDDFSTIQEAIDNAVDGDTIFVKAGTYYEHVIVNKSISLQGEDVSTTIIDGSESGHVVCIVRSDVNVTGFTIRNSGHVWNAGIRLDSAPDSQIHSNIITGNNYGVVLYSSPRVSILNNTVASNEFGVRVAGGSGYLNVSDNVVMNNRDCGIGLTGNMTMSSHSVTVANNLVMNNGDGINLGRYSNYNTISRNNISMNTRYGLYIEYSTENMIYSNNFVDNDLQAYLHIAYVYREGGWVCVSPSENAWDNGYPSGGNYWSDYSGADAYKGFCQNETGSDGIGDTPVVVGSCWGESLGVRENNTDRYPLMTQYIPDTQNIPEFPSFLMLPTFFVATLLAVIVYRRKHTRNMHVTSFL